MKEREIYKIEYVDSKEKHSERTIIPTMVPSSNIKAIDVSDMTEEETNEICQYFTEYTNYVDIQNKNIYTFEDFISHTKGKDVNIKWRTFNKERIKTK